jgi:hypothetical protein
MGFGVVIFASRIATLVKRIDLAWSVADTGMAVAESLTYGVGPPAWGNREHVLPRLPEVSGGHSTLDDLPS